jgi:hypothetical protein
MAGPHDGTSILESAIDEMLMQRKNFSVVLPAGNFYKSSCHATVKLSDSRPSGKLKLQVRADDPTDTFVELWWPCVADNLRMPEVLISVQPPGAAPSSGKVASGNVRIWDGEQRWLDLGGAVLPEPACSVLRLPKTVLSTGNSAMALIALSPTRAGRVERPLAPHGVWEVTVEFGSSHQGELVIDAWIERDDQALGSRRSRSQAVFLEDHEPDAVEVAGGRAPVDRCNTMSNIACGAQPVIVGGCVLDGTELSGYTSSGPGCGGVRSSGPDVVAPSDESGTLSGLLAAGTRSETWVRMGGTSVAAPIVARRLANILAARDAAGESPVTSDQLKELLLKEVEPQEPQLPAGPDLPVRRGGGFLRGEC